MSFKFTGRFFVLSYLVNGRLLFLFPSTILTDINI